MKFETQIKSTEQLRPATPPHPLPLQFSRRILASAVRSIYMACRPDILRRYSQVIKLIVVWGPAARDVCGVVNVHIEPHVSKKK